MPTLYARSTDGNNADNGTTWALAKATLAGIDGIDAAGDVIYVSQAHAESTAAAVTIALAGTRTVETRIICGNDAAEPPTATATTATVTTTGNSNLTIGGALSQYWYGIGFVCGSGGSGTARLSVTARKGLYENCSFYAASTSGGDIRLTTDSELVLQNCDFRFNQTTVATMYLLGAGEHYILGGQLNASTSGPANFITLSGTTSRLMVEGMDLSSGPTGMNLITGTASTSMYASFRNCKLPASWSGQLYSGTHNDSEVFEMFNCASGDVNYAYRRDTTWGYIVHETTLVKTGGASDGTTPISWKFVTNAAAEYPLFALSSAKLQKWNETTGSAITVTVDFLHDSATNLQDDEIWIEVQYLGTSGFPLGTFTDDAAADVLTTPADQTTSAATWTTTGMANPNEQKLSVTFTPQEKGLIIARVCMAVASTTVYIDPVLQVS